MNRKIALLWTAPLLLGFSAGWAEHHDGDEEAALVDAADDAAVQATAGRLPSAAAEGLATAADATMRLMDGDDDDGAAVTSDVLLPAYEEADPEGYRGLDTASDAIDGREDFGAERAEAAADNAAEMAEESLNSVEGRSRVEDLPLDTDLPGRPEELPIDPGI